MSVERARTLYALARHRLDRGDLARGQPLWREVRAVFARLGMRGDLAQLESARGRRRGQPQTAVEPLQCSSCSAVCR